jgi:chemotaxis protein methyltransferase CheR
MIYFNRETQGDLVERFTNLLAPGGVLLVGHSESLRGGTPGLRFVLPAVYERQPGS